MLFADRTDAGIQLVKKLQEYQLHHPVVLAIPRGGVPIGYQLAINLDAPLDLVVIRKLGAPGNPELAIGAIAPGGIKILDEQIIRQYHITEAEITAVEWRERQELERRMREYGRSISLPDIQDKTAIIVDDGLATGITAQAAVVSILHFQPAHLIVAAPICSEDAMMRITQFLRPNQDFIVCLSIPHHFQAISSWYQQFEQVTDEEVVSLLNRAKTALASHVFQPTHHDIV